MKYGKSFHYDENSIAEQIMEELENALEQFGLIEADLRK